MRKILLAGAAMLATTGMAMAVSTSGTQITLQTQVNRACSVVFDDTSNLALPSNGDESTGKGVTLACNFTDTSADITFTSAFQGVKSTTPNLDAPNPFPYTMTYQHGASPVVALGDSTAARTASNVASVPGPSVTTGVFKAKLVNPITVAGTFEDTVTVSVSP